MSPWFHLVIAGLLEVGWAVGLKFTEGFTRLGPSLLTVGAMILSMWLLGLAARELPLSTAYPVWVGIGAAGAVVMGALLFGEKITLLRGVFLVLLCASIIGLNVTTPPEDDDAGDEHVIEG